MNIVKIIPLLTTGAIPSDYGMGDLVDILLFIARALIIAVSGSIGLIKISSGKANEDPKETNYGFVSLVAGGIIFAATFAIEAIF